MSGFVRSLAITGLLHALLSAAPVSQDPRQLGEVQLRELVVKDDKVSIRVDSGGCTDNSSIRPIVKRTEGSVPVPHYDVTFERIAIDECKAMLFDGVVLDYSIAKDLKISGPFTLTVTNPVVPYPGAAKKEASTLEQALRASTRKAMELELKGYRDRLKAAEGGLGPAGNVERFKKNVAEMETMIQAFDAKPLGEEPSPVQDEDPLAQLGKASFGPVVPAKKRVLKVTVKEPVQPGSLLEAEGTSRSGPFYHAADGALDKLKPGHSYAVTAYLVYKREYVGFIPCYFVHIAEVK